MGSVVLECFPVEETFALTGKYILQKKTKAKSNKNSLTWVRQLPRNNRTKPPSQSRKWAKDGRHFSKDSSPGLSMFPTCLCLQLYSETSRRKENFPQGNGYKWFATSDLVYHQIYHNGKRLFFFRRFFKYPCVILCNKHQIQKILDLLQRIL